VKSGVRSLTTAPRVFIIESLNLEDKDTGKREGSFLKHILRLHGKKTHYAYIESTDELHRNLHEFEHSRDRYLYFSLHASPSSIETPCDSLSFRRFARILRPYLKGRRLFLSACYAVNKKLAREIFRDSGCISLIGPDERIRFSDAAVVYAAFFHLVFTRNSKRMTKKSIIRALVKIRDTFGISLNYYMKNRNAKDGFISVRWNSSN
jgi:hypothetical protein